MKRRAVVHVANMDVHEIDNIEDIDMNKGMIILSTETEDRYYPFGSIEYVEIIREGK